MIHPIRVVDKYIFETDFPEELRTVGTYWPSEASLVIDGRSVGTCMRQSWYRYMGIESSDPVTVSRIRRMQWGNLIEANERMYLRRSGLLYAENVPVEAKYNDIFISGKLDAVINKSDPVIVEIKSGYGDAFFRNVLSPDTGNPSPAHILQGLLYLYMYSEANSLVFMYYDRGNANRREHWLSLDRFIGVINNKTDEAYNVLAVLQRFELLHKHIINKILPKRDYAPIYTGSDFLRNNSGRQISRKTIRDISAGQEIGDWQCKECPFKSRCIDEG